MPMTVINQPDQIAERKDPRFEQTMPVTADAGATVSVRGRTAMAVVSTEDSRTAW